MLFALPLAACAGASTSAAATQPSLSELEARVAALEAQLAAQPNPAPEAHTEAAAGRSDAFDVAVAQYVMETAGFHAMDDGLTETKTVDPAYLSTVNRVRKVVAQAPWPDDLHAQVEDFESLLADFSAALEADNGEAAASLAAQVHESQHDLSHAIDDWLGSAADHGD
jgi:hypothetical protein